MSDLKLFQLSSDSVSELKGRTFELESTLGDDVQERTLKNYFEFTCIKNFACVEIKPAVRKLLVYLKVDPSSVDHLKLGFTRDVTKIGHFGIG